MQTKLTLPAQLLSACIVLISVLTHDAMAHTSANDTDSLGYNRPDWMGQLPDDTPLTQLSVPGTHDTMAYDDIWKVLSWGGIGQCQSVSLSKQLKGGIRALDIRCRHFHNKFPIHHDKIYLNAHFDDVMDDCVAFLDAHPSETIFMRIADEYKKKKPAYNTRSFQATLLAYLNKYPPERIWETDDWGRLPSLGEVRGKIVIFDAFPDDPELTQCGYQGVSDGCDHYDTIDYWDKKDSYDELWNFIKAHLVKANAESPSSKIFTTNLNGYAYPITPWDVADDWNRLWPLPDIDGMNRRTYRYLRDLLNQGNNHRLGWVMMDFPGRGLIDVIIAHNGLGRLLENDPPVADAGGPYVAGEGATILLDGSASYSLEGMTLSYSWDLYDDGMWEISGTNDPYALFIVGDNMETRVALAVSERTGAMIEEDRDVSAMVITNIAPTVFIDNVGSIIPGCIMSGHEVVFYGSFSDPGYMDTHLADWYFSEGGITAGVITGENDPSDATGLIQTMNSYAAPGIYTVSLAVTDDDDGTGWATTEVLVRTPAQVCRFMIEFIQSLELSAFSHPQAQHRNALCQKLKTLGKTIDKRDANGSVQKLANDLRTKWDGQSSGRKNSDWITDPAAQEVLCLTADELIFYITP